MLMDRYPTTLEYSQHFGPLHNADDPTELIVDSPAVVCPPYDEGDRGVGQTQNHMDGGMYMKILRRMHLTVRRARQDEGMQTTLLAHGGSGKSNAARHHRGMKDGPLHVTRAGSN
jgi:hypothetical protein